MEGSISGSETIRFGPFAVSARIETDRCPLGMVFAPNSDAQ
jgi:hypothetical protein